ncbi:MAG: type II secretion system F family protein [Clostridia bacterium]|nr:type II secretion system F family protein [Clostridia bacterium]
MKRIDTSEAALQRRAIKRIFLVITAGMLLLLFDLFVGFDAASLQLMKGDSGLYLVRPDEGRSAGHINLQADIKTDTGTVSKRYDLSLYPYAKMGGRSATGGTNAKDPAGAMSGEELLSYEMRSLISSLNDDQSIRRVSLPDHLRTGEKITWSVQRRTNMVVIAFGMLFLTVFIYVRRLDPLDKLRRAQMDSVNRQLPEFVNRLVLLLGAGLVLSAAFERIVEESRETESLRGDYFYGCMDGIYSRIKETNGSLQKEFRSFARSGESSCEGTRDLMRISNILSDNISKGVELTDKLQSESETLWLARKRRSEERGRLAETKLTMPLTVFLLVLVVVTVSPALLEL